MKYFLALFITFLFVRCSSDKKESFSQKKLDTFFEQASNSNLSKEKRLKYLDSASFIINNFSENDSLKTKNYFKIANRYFMLLEYDEYKKTTEEILKLSKSKNDSINIAKAEYYLGDFYFSKSQNDSAYYHYLSAEKKYKLLKDKPNLSAAILHKAYVLLFEKDFLGSETETIKVLNIAKEIDDNSLIYECYVNLGSSLLGLGDYNKALNYHQKALNQIKEVEDKNYHPIFQAQTLNNIGFVYLNMNKFDDAIENFSRGLKIKNLKDIHIVLYSALLDNYAYSKFKINKEDALKDFNKALKIRDSIDDIAGKINSRIHLTEYYLLKKDTVKALQLNDEAIKLAKTAKYNKEVLTTLEFYTKLKPKEGLFYAKEYIKLNDSLQRQERATRNKLARIEFETDEIIVEKEAISNQRKIILFSSLLIIFFGVLLYIILFQRSKQKELLFNQEQQKSNEEIYTLMLDKQEELDEARKAEKTRISQELHDGIMNRLTSTRLNLFVLTRKRDDETIQKCIEHINAIQDIEKEVRAIAHELNNEAFLTKGNFKTLLEELMHNQKQTYETECDCEMTQDDEIENVNAVVKMHVYRIIQEALNNINKYAKATKITLRLEVENHNLKLLIVDDGIGFNVKKAKNGIGLKNMYSRTQAINGKLEIFSEKNEGTTIKLKVKL
ncbi:MAG: tetratricopeptide repeat protein [Flavobacterium sp.]|uniref:tetratricopeptide repeat-containing sensor histidine kinase n=1 Tax=Flavobacterium sp. TaxID=239 RepID=UPI0037B23A99